MVIRQNAVRLKQYYRDLLLERYLLWNGYNSISTMMKNISFLLILMLACLIGCKKIVTNPINDKVEATLKIRAGFMCGWGSGEDSLYISNSTIKYVYYVPAKSMLPKIQKTRFTTDSEWANITNSLNINYFLKLSYNTCNICVDGCDEWISIQDDKVSHQIRFGLGSKIDSLNTLQNILGQLRSEFNK
jgi:hypothetical protein